MLDLSLLLSLLLLALPSVALPPVAKGARQAHPAPESVVCVHCAGEGRLEQTCPVCRGEGDHPCLACASFRYRTPVRWEAEWTSPAIMAVVLEDMRKTFADLKEIDFQFLAPGKKSPKGVKLKPGELRCPANCVGGKLLHIQTWVDCKLCSNGKFSCDFCRGGRTKCLPCAGKGRILSACDSCAGTGRTPDPDGLDVTVCSVCLGSATRACGSCDAQGKVQLPCQSCLNARKLPCAKCHGIGRLACKKCGGRTRFGPQKANCEDCKRKGVLVCGDCVQGVVPCPLCWLLPVGEPSLCPDCQGKKEHPCNGCGAGAYLAWELAAQTLVREGDPEQAALWVAEACVRCEARYDKAIESRPAKEGDELSAKIQRALEAERRRELGRLRSLLR